MGTSRSSSSGKHQTVCPTHPRVRFVPVATADDPGPAWAAGFEAAQGEYAWFVDPAGHLADGALAAVAARLHDLRPDLLLIGHHGRTGPPVQLPAAAGVFTVAQRPDAFDSAPEVWARVVRRDLVARAGFPFHRGRYAEVTFSYPLLVAAERIAVLDRVCYHAPIATARPGRGRVRGLRPVRATLRAARPVGRGRSRRPRPRSGPPADRRAHDGPLLVAVRRQRPCAGDTPAWILRPHVRAPAALPRAGAASRAGLDDRLVGRDRWKTYVAVRSVRQFTRTAGERIRQAVAPNGR